MSADPVADQSADVFHLPGRDPWAELDRPGKVPAFTFRQSVADENGKITGMSWDWRT